MGSMHYNDCVSVTVVHASESIQAVDYRCTARRHDRPFTEVHDSYAIAYVRRGSFGCKARGRHYDLVRGSLLLGRPGDEYVCSHDHAAGDECLSFHLAASLVDELSGWEAGAVPPLAELVVLGELAQAAARGDSELGVDEVGFALAAKFAAVAKDKASAVVASPADRKRAVEIAMWMSEHPGEDASLDALAARAGLSPFHFLRVFGAALGVTPHQYLVRSRLRLAAQLLAHDDRAITDVAYDVGFADVSNFVRTFQRAAGVSPRQFRRAARGDRKIFQDRIAARP